MKVNRPIHIVDPTFYFESPSWTMQEKLDGKRCVISTGSKLSALSRNNLPLQLSEELHGFLCGLPPGWTFDGELIGSVYYVFDVLEVNSNQVSNFSWKDRYNILTSILTKDYEFIKLVPCLTSKSAEFDRLRQDNTEGVIFKDLRSSYTGGEWFKFKFYKSVDCIVTDTALNSKNSLELSVYTDNRLLPIGQLSSLTGDGPRVKCGDIVEVTYLKFTTNRRLYQASNPKLRTDKLPEECTIEQLFI